MRKTLTILFALSGLVFLYSLYVIIDETRCDARCQEQYEKRMEAYAMQLRECGHLIVKQTPHEEDATKP